MINKNLIHGFVVLIVIVLTACSSDDNKEGPITELQGSWKSACASHGSETSYIITTYTFVGSNISNYLVSYSDASCTSDKMLLEATATAAYSGGTNAEWGGLQVMQKL